MSHDILKKYMMSFSMESLKGFLGEVGAKVTLK